MATGEQETPLVGNSPSADYNTLFGEREEEKFVRNTVFGKVSSLIAAACTVSHFKSTAVRTDKFSIEHTNVGLAHACPIPFHCITKTWLRCMTRHNSPPPPPPPTKIVWPVRLDCCDMLILVYLKNLSFKSHHFPISLGSAYTCYSLAHTCLAAPRCKLQ